MARPSDDLGDRFGTMIQDPPPWLNHPNFGPINTRQPGVRYAHLSGMAASAFLI